MAKLAETFLIEYLNRQGFAVAQSVKNGNREWDVLAISASTPVVRACHYEVQVSFDPVSYISARNAKRRSAEEINRDMQAWFDSKFQQPRIRAIRSHFFGGEWEFWFVHGVVKEQRELDWLNEHNVQLLPFSQLLASLCAEHPRNLPFTAEGKDMVEIIRNMLNGENGI